jgi:tetratricopeptide (TPR) repeat protein
MKNSIIYLVCTLFLLNTSRGNIMISKQESDSFINSPAAARYRTYQNDTLLINIQAHVQNAFVNGKINNSDKDLAGLEQALLSRSRNNNNSIITYWYSYACYYHSILFLSQKENKRAEKILDEGIMQLNKIVNPNSEHLALLALMESLSIQYASGMEIPGISKRARQNAEKALQLDSLNLRAYYVLGSNDFYSPAQYGGGKKAEGYLLKAIRLKEQSVTNPILPSWGKNSAYEMLIRVYIKQKEYAEAKKYYMEASALYPNDYMISKLSKEIINF